MIQKSIQDYYEEVAKLCPDFCLSDIKKILLHGWKNLYRFTIKGDAYLATQHCHLYFGRYFGDSVKYYYYYARKLSYKVEKLYKIFGVPWEGYYYFAATERQGREFLAGKGKRGRPKKKFNWEHILMHRFFDVCNIRNCDKHYIFRIKWPTYMGDSFYIRKTTLVEPELVLHRPHLKLKEILFENYPFQYRLDNTIRQLNPNTCQQLKTHLEAV